MVGGIMSAPEQQNTRAVWLDRLLGLLRSWQLLVICCTALLVLLLASLVLPQIPGQISEDPVATARWLQEWNVGSGQLSALQRALGLYAVLQSPFFHFLIVLAIILAFVHLADTTALALSLRRLPDSVLYAAAFPPGDPIVVVYPRPIFRIRQAAPQPPSVARDAVEEILAAQSGRILRKILTENAQPSLDTAELPNLAASDAARQGETPREWRWLVLRHEASAWLRPLLFAGLVLALVSLWAATYLGWSVTPPPLAPGENYVYPPHELKLEYDIVESGLELRPALTATVGGETILLHFETERTGRVGGAEVRLTPGPPALWVSAPDAVLLAPGGLPDEARQGLGLLFPQPGSEQVVVLADGNAGLRIVRLAVGQAGATDFLVEVYEGENVQPTQRVQVSNGATLVVGPEDAALALRLTPMAGVQADVRRQPGLWLLWLALMMTAVGALGFLQRPGFTIVQLAPWPVERSVVIVQSDERAVSNTFPTVISNGLKKLTGNLVDDGVPPGKG